MQEYDRRQRAPTRAFEHAHAGGYPRLSYPSAERPARSAASPRSILRSMSSVTHDTPPPPLASAARERSWLLRTLHRGRPAPWAADPGAFDADDVRRTVERVGRLFGERRYFGLDARGFENVPAAPVMFVSNHSGGTTIPDVWGFGVAWYRAFGVERPLHFMTHELILATAATGRYFARRGALRASWASARAALGTWRRDVIVMPGGDLDAWRPHRRRFEVELGGRIGYARVALELGVPIVPVANSGPHDTLYVLTDGRRIARAFGLHRIARAEIGPCTSRSRGASRLVRCRTSLFRGSFGTASARRFGPTRETPRTLDARVRRAVQMLLDDLGDRRA